MMRQTLMIGVFLILSSPTVVAEDKRADAQVREKAAEKRFAKLKEYCQERRVTHIVELLAEWGEFAGKEQQEVVLDMAAGLVKDAQKEAKKLGESRGIPAAPRTEFRGVSATADVKNLSKAASAYFVDEFASVQFRLGGRMRENAPNKHVVVASTRFVARPNFETEDSVILTNDADAEIEAANYSVIVASGNLAAYDVFRHSTVVCRGQVEYRMMGQECSLIKAGGQLVDTLTRQTNGEVPQPKPDPRRAFPNDKDLLGVKFYSAIEDGIEAIADKKKETVTVAKLDEKKPFAKAGLKIGDEIGTINGERVRTLHELDRLL